MTVQSRSREGAWIEIVIAFAASASAAGRSREGAWIEIPLRNYPRGNGQVAPVRERGLK